MQNSKVLRGYLIIAGALLTFIGGAQLLFPVAMKASSGIDLAGNISVINDIRAANALILAVALLSHTGAFVKRFTFTSSLVVPLLFLSLATGRIISILLDGMPVEGMLGATGLEVILGLIGAVFFTRYQEKGVAVNAV